MAERRGLVKMFGARIEVEPEGDAPQWGEERKEHLIEESESGHAPFLGKHPRDETSHSPKNPENCYDMKESSRKPWIPKALRIHNPDEAAKSSIWAATGIKKSLADGIGSRGPLKALQPIPEIRNQRTATSQVLHANPAALLRSIKFQESI